MIDLENEINEIFRIRISYDLFRDLDLLDQDKLERSNQIIKFSNVKENQKRWRLKMLSQNRCVVCSRPISIENKELCNFHRQQRATRRSLRHYELQNRSK